MFLTHSYMEELAETRHVTFVLRLVLNQSGRVSHGELIDAESGRSHNFRDRSDLRQTLAEWLNQLESAAANDAALS